MSSSSLGCNEAFVLFDGHQISVDFLEHTQPGISPPIFKTSPVHGAEHICDTGFVSVSILHESSSPSLHHLYLLYAWLCMRIAHCTCVPPGALAGQLCTRMREQRIAKLPLNSVFQILKLITLFTMSSQKVTISNVVNFNAYSLSLQHFEIKKNKHTLFLQK